MRTKDALRQIIRERRSGESEPYLEGQSDFLEIMITDEYFKGKDEEVI